MVEIYGFVGDVSVEFLVYSFCYYGGCKTGSDIVKLVCLVSRFKDFFFFIL